MRRLQALIASALNAREGEGLLLSLILALFLLKGVCDVFFATSASTLFLEAFGTEQLPYVYIGSAVVVTLVGLLYARMATQLSTEVLLQTTLVFVVVSVGVFHVALAVQPSKWSLSGLMIWRELLYMLLNAAFWARVGMLFDVRQAKRLFPVVAAGEIASGAIGGAVIPLIVHRIGPLHLLVFAELSMALGIAVAAIIDRVARTSAAPLDEDLQPDERPLSRLLRQPYLALFFAVSMLSYVIYFIVDFAFYAVVNGQFPNPESLAAFFGVFYAVLNAVNLAVNAFFAGRLLLRFGIAIGLLALPVCVGSGTFAAIASAGAGLALFWPIVATKLIDEMLRGAFLYPTYKILYQPLPLGQRLRVQAIRDSIVEPVAMGLSGILLLVLTSARGVGVAQLSYGLAIVLVVFGVLSVRLRREYVVALGRSLSKRRPIDDHALLSNASSLAVIRRRLEGADAVEAIYCLELLEKIDPVALREVLPRMVTHAHPDVRQDVWRRLRGHSSVDDVPALQALVATETVPAVVGEAVRTLCSVTRDGAHQWAAPFLTHPSTDVRAATLGGLLRHGSGAAVDTASATVQTLARSSQAADRISAARILADAATPDLIATLRGLLDDADPDVARAALRSAGRLRTADLAPAVLEKLAVAELREHAATALVDLGDACAALLQTAIGETRDRATACRMTRVLARMRTAAAVEALVAHVGHADENVRHAVLEALANRRFAAAGPQVAAVRAVLDAELATAAWLLACRRDIGSNDAVSLVAAALKNDYDETCDRILLLVSFMHAAQPVLRARALFGSGSERQRAQALETLDNLLSGPVKRALLPLFDDVLDSDRLAELERRYPQAAVSSVDRLYELLTASRFGASSWSRACAAYEGARLGGRELLDAVRQAAGDRDALVCETAQALCASATL